VRRALWINLVGVNMVAGLVAGLLLLPELYRFDTLWQIRLMVLGMPLLVALWVWQMVGMWRGAGLEPLPSGRGNLIRAAVGTAAACLALSVASGAGAVADMASAALGRDTLGHYALTARADGTLVVQGDIGFGLAARVRTALRESPSLTRVQLDSPGGRGGEGALLARVIREADADTVVHQGCFSACAFAFLGGHRRSLAPGAQLGFHWRRRALDWSELELRSQVRRAFRDAGVDNEFTAHALAVPIEDLWIPSRRELWAAGVITSPDFDAYPIPHFRG